MGKRGNQPRVADDDEMGIEASHGIQIKTKAIKKLGQGKAARRGQPTKQEVESRNSTADKKREAIRLRLKNKNKIKHNPGLLKDFNERFETESKRMLSTGKHSHNQKKRLKRKVILLLNDCFSVLTCYLGPFFEKETLC